MQQASNRFDLPAGLVIFSADGKAQFGWQNPETGAYYAEDDGHCIVDAIGGVPWHADTMH
ncbi:MAG TPA: hypothetical protein VJU59_21505 [Paraburkholderia sp.]|uniref:hypothetical protein n=1 Tax=Paraburkholderia sp. TaxID=1926495 RepID=UPI002B4985EE|nr:hypothetical protein [Paraburkholderia sp.]HKR42216.1 hypothetical protein [Paraburkholderia sp.]